MAASEDQSLRWRQLLRLLDVEGFVTVASLCRRLHTSEPTVRRDLVALERQGLLRRVRGGAVAHGPGESPFVRRVREHAAEKQAIAARAAAEIGPGQCVALDIGTTMVYLAQILADRGAISGTRFVTNGLRTARALARSGTPVVVTGGVLRPGEDSLVGPVARRAVRGYAFDAFFLSASAVTPRGVLDVNMDEIEVKQEFLLRSAATYALVDSRKMAADGPGVRACDLRALTGVVTDPGITAASRRFLQEAGVRVLVGTMPAR